MSTLKLLRRGKEAESDLVVDGKEMIEVLPSDSNPSVINLIGMIVVILISEEVS